MSTMNVSLPEPQKAYVEEQCKSGRYTSSSEFIRDLIRKDQDRQQLRALVLEGMASPSAGVADAEYFDDLRRRVREDDWQ